MVSGCATGEAVGAERDEQQNGRATQTASDHHHHHHHHHCNHHHCTTNRQPLAMAWRCSGKTNAELIANLRTSGLITSQRVADAMTNVDRLHYTPNRSAAYQDSPQSIGYGATISAPHMHAHAAEALLPFLAPGNSVLDVGSGSGYTMAIFHHLVNAPSGAGSEAASANARMSRVVGIDHIPELVDSSKQNLINDGLGEALNNGQIHAVAGDGRRGACMLSSNAFGNRRSSSPPSLHPGRLPLPGALQRDPRRRSGANDTRISRGTTRKTRSALYPRRRPSKRVRTRYLAGR